MERFLNLQKNKTKQERTMFLLPFFFILFALIFQQINARTQNPILYQHTGLLRYLIYFLLFIFWGLRNNWRITHQRIKVILQVMSFFMVIWLLLRMMRYYFSIENEVLLRQLWYAYYLPILLLPTLSVVIAGSMGIEKSRYPLILRIIFYLIPFSLMMLVLSNESHQLAFKIYEFPLKSGFNYEHKIVYWLVFVWVILCSIFFLILLYQKTKRYLYRSAFIYLMMPIIFGVVYALLYNQGFFHRLHFADELPIVICLIYIAILEFSIYYGLIPSNRNYELLFNHSHIKSFIVDQNHKIQYGSTNDPSLISKIIEEKNVIIDHKQLHAHTIKGGHVIWEEDIFKIQQLFEELENIGLGLEKDNQLMEAELNIRKRKLSVDTQKEYYRKLLQELWEPFETFESYIDLDIPQEQKIYYLALYGAYLKRMLNLHILKETQSQLDVQELHYCLKEICDVLSDKGLEIFLKNDASGMMNADDLIEMYRKFQEILMMLIEQMDSMFISLTQDSNQVILKIQISKIDEVPINLPYEVIEEQGTVYVKILGGKQDDPA